jgi:hypothetical protein
MPRIKRIRNPMLPIAMIRIFNLIGKKTLPKLKI